MARHSGWGIAVLRESAATESDLRLETVGQMVAPSASGIDAVFCLDRGSAIDLGDGKDVLSGVRPGGEPVMGWVVKHSHEVLFDFLGWLSVTMPRELRMERILTRYVMPTRD